MVYIRSRKFCCCIPVRFGVFILSLLGVAGGTLVCIVGWLAVSQLWKHPLPVPDTIGIWLHASLFTILTLLSLFGFIGCLVKSRNSVHAYSVGLLITLLLSIASGSYSLWALFHHNSQKAVKECLNGGGDTLTQAVCKNGVNVYKGVTVAIYILIWLLMIYAYVIVDNYIEQLDDEISMKETRQMINAIRQPRVTVAPVAVPTYASFGAPQAALNTGYAFSHNNQSYGVRGNNSMV
ncbi:hypothetical protein D9615_005502 [Tricholomella constricta]|uniref:Uncharacterized protein n=1 Tax=Tricholomella constricta TaxID=117010 RepID=A0A8H5HDZ6_9AGAR|nr:hypothetical protein D9615_005502 [Tricholomella constricta]